MRTTQTHVFFWRTADIYSQWHPAPFSHEGSDYDTAERFMMASKALLFKDLPSYLQIIQAKTPAEVKKLGRGVAGFKSAVWDDNKMSIVELGNYLKFSQNEDLKAQLLATGDRVLVEASPEDLVWGVGLAEEDPAIEDEGDWKGQNLLGKALMRVRVKFEMGIGKGGG